jgi:hypothetical protein
MEALVVHCFSVAGIHCIWRAYQRWQVKRRRRIGHRVAYMLWVAAQNAGERCKVA